ncbi:MAG: DegV family protein [Oscillospiraceae bacterium]|nr:DegV family protein [Oscillospiraceae bacterium]
MNYRIVSDSSSNMLSFPGIDFRSVPLRIITAKHEYVDNAELDVEKMVGEIRETKGKSGTSCPNIGDWLNAFDGADIIFAITITSRLSGSFASAEQATKIFMDAHPGAKVFVVDSLSTGPEMRIIMEHIREKMLRGGTFEEIRDSVTEYRKHTHLLFSLESLTNLARNGRVSPAVAKIAGVLGIRVMGAAKEGVLDPLHKIRGEAKTLDMIFAEMKKRGFSGGKVVIDHCFNQNAANLLAEKILSEFPSCDLKIGRNGALCSFYAERGGVLIGFEDSL